MLSAMFLLFLAYSIFCIRRHAIVECSEYLKVLDCDKWKDVQEIKLEVENLKKVKLMEPEVCSALLRLKTWRLVEMRTTEKVSGDVEVPCLEFRSRSGRRSRKRKEKLSFRFKWLIPQPDHV